MDWMVPNNFNNIIIKLIHYTQRQILCIIAKYIVWCGQWHREKR